MTETLAWRKSSYCSNATCLEVAPSDESGNVYVRDSKLKNSPILAFDRSAWTDFLNAMKNGDLDR